jgi:hypothetical protein
MQLRFKEPKLPLIRGRVGLYAAAASTSTSELHIRFAPGQRACRGE